MCVGSGSTLSAVSINHSTFKATAVNQMYTSLTKTHTHTHTHIHTQNWMTKLQGEFYLSGISTSNALPVWAQQLLERGNTQTNTRVLSYTLFCKQPDVLPSVWKRESRATHETTSCERYLNSMHASFQAELLDDFLHRYDAGRARHCHTWTLSAGAAFKGCS